MRAISIIMAAMNAAETRRALWAHVLPFVAWIAIMELPVFAAPVRYAIQTGVTLALLAVLRPWRYYEMPRIGQLPLAVVSGLGVAAFWILPEAGGLAWAPGVRDLYLRWGIRPFGALPSPVGDTPFAPEQCGWALSCVRLAGSAFVIAAAEEFFWRGFLYRWLQSREFLVAQLSAIRWPIFLLVCVLFGLEHDRWLAGIGAGFVYGWLYARTRDIGAAVAAHVTTNFVLGCYVLATGAYRFW